MIAIQDLHTITIHLKGVQLDQLLSLIEGDDDPDNYAFDAIRHIQSALTSLHAGGIIDDEEYNKVMLHAHRMKELIV